MSSPKLFQPIQVGVSELKHRVVFAPSTRFRADSEHAPLPHVAEYYSQRSKVPGTLLITEATLIAPRAGGYAHVPGIWSDAQIASWKKVNYFVYLLSISLRVLGNRRCTCEWLIHLPTVVGSRPNCFVFAAAKGRSFPAIRISFGCSSGRP
jgi:hypothetical protein